MRQEFDKLCMRCLLFEKSEYIPLSFALGVKKYIYSVGLQLL